MTETEYDLIVIGGGAIAENVAGYAVEGGLTAVLIESELFGGECSYWACMPSKALIRSGSLLRSAQNVEGTKQAVTGSLDVAATLARRNSFTSNWDDTGQVEWIEGAGIDYVRGHGRITGVKKVSVETADGSFVELTARHAVCVSTGSDPMMPDVPGLLEAKPWTPRDATSSQVIPPSLAIIGGGVVAVEMATAYASFGCKVTVIARSGLLRSEEHFAAEMVSASLQKMGVTLRLGEVTTAVTRSGSDVTISLSGGGDVVASEVLVATGRLPRSADIGLETIGLEPGSWLPVDDTLLVKGDTNSDSDWLYATGDVNHRVLMTHQGKYQARIAGDVIAARALGKPVQDEPWGAHVATADHASVPQVTFSDPEVAYVGLNSIAAKKAGYNIRVVDYDLGWVSGSSLHADGYQGKARMVVDEDRKVVLGVTFVGPDVSELIYAATIAVVGEVPLSRLWHAVPAYPTMNEIWLRLFETYRQPATT